MSKEEELTQKDYEDAARRYHYALPAGEKERWERAVGAAAEDFAKFWSGGVGLAARKMLKEGVKAISFSGQYLGEEGSITIDSEGFSCRGKNATDSIPMSEYELIWEWCAVNRG